jgi:hypothetical protein
MLALLLLLSLTLANPNDMEIESFRKDLELLIAKYDSLRLNPFVASSYDAAYTTLSQDENFLPFRDAFIEELKLSFCPNTNKNNSKNKFLAHFVQTHPLKSRFDSLFASPGNEVNLLLFILHISIQAYQLILDEIDAMNAKKFYKNLSFFVFIGGLTSFIVCFSLYVKVSSAKFFVKLVFLSLLVCVGGGIWMIVDEKRKGLPYHYKTSELL